MAPNTSQTEQHEATSQASPHNDQPEHADERTIRRIAEEQVGGMSTDEMLERYESGEHPGGMQGGAFIPPEDMEEGKVRESLHAEPYDDEPADPKMRRPGHRRGMSTQRAGS